MVRRVKWFCSLLVILSSQCALAVSYPLPPEGSRLVGSPQRVTVPHNNTQPLEAFAAQYGQGLSNMLEANPGVDVFLPKSGTTLVIPQQLILPDTVREGIVVNVAEMRLYYYPPEGNTVEVLPIGIGQAVKFTAEPDGSRWVEVHEPLSRNRAEYESDRKVPLPTTTGIQAFVKGEGVNVIRAEQALERRSGMPVNISEAGTQSHIGS